MRVVKLEAVGSDAAVDAGTSDGAITIVVKSTADANPIADSAVELIRSRVWPQGFDLTVFRLISVAAEKAFNLGTRSQYGRGSLRSLEGLVPDPRNCIADDPPLFSVVKAQRSGRGLAKFASTPRRFHDAGS